MSAKMFGTDYENATGEETAIKPENVATESKLTHIVNHVKEYKVLYFGLIAIGAWVVYKKFIKK